ncbi:MAG: M48 family metallopeptidase [Bacteroidota bacterium]
MERKRIIDLNPVEYEHPYDKNALDRLENTRGLELVTRKVLDYGLERYHRILHTGDNIRVTPDNIPELHKLMEEACEILEMEERPELYLHLEDKITSISSGEKKLLIVLSTGAIELLTDDELLFLIGRELGHIKSNHVLYRMMADSLQVVSQVIGEISFGIGNLVSMPLRVALLHWYRMSEFTADRAGLLACQDMDVAANAFVKIAGLPHKYHGRVTVEDFRNQAEEFEEVGEKSIDKLINFIAVHDQSQPFTVIRGSQLFQWEESGKYEAILARDSFRDLVQRNREEMKCHQCGFEITSEENYCRMCGTKLKEEA